MEARGSRSRKADELMAKLPVADVAAWLRAELRETPLSQYAYRGSLSHLLLKLGYDVGRDETTQPDRVTTEITG